MQESQELIQRLNQSGKKLSKSHKRIAEYIVAHYDKAAFMTASKLGEYVGVSESTVVRFADALGYEGYPQLQKALQELIRHRLTASQRFEMSTEMPQSMVLSRVLKADMQNIRNTLDINDESVFDSVVGLMRNAEHIYILGLRSSAVRYERAAGGDGCDEYGMTLVSSRLEPGSDAALVRDGYAVYTEISCDWTRRM